MPLASKFHCVFQFIESLDLLLGQVQFEYQIINFFLFFFIGSFHKDMIFKLSGGNRSTRRKTPSNNYAFMIYSLTD